MPRARMRARTDEVQPCPMSSLLLCGRNQAVCVRIGCSPKAAPLIEDRRSRKSSGVSVREVETCDSRPGSTVSDRLFAIAWRYVSALLVQSMPAPMCGTGEST